MSRREFVVGRNPDPASSLPYLLLIPVEPDPVVLKAREPWPTTTKVYCHAADGWPDDVTIVERVPVRSCVRRGAAIDLVLDRSRLNRSQFVFARAKGRQVIFWQSARTARKARPGVSLPTARAAGRILPILVDTHERYAWRFADQQATTSVRALPAGDYALERDGVIVAAVERKSIEDLVSSLTGGRLQFLLAELATLGRAAVVVEDRWSAVFKQSWVRPAVVADGLAQLQVRFPTVPIVFAETRQLAQEWTYRFLAAALDLEQDADDAARIEADLATAPSLPAPPPSDAEVRRWARSVGLPVADRGRVAGEVRAAYLAAQQGVTDDLRALPLGWRAEVLP